MGGWVGGGERGGENELLDVNLWGGEGGGGGQEEERDLWVGWKEDRKIHTG